MSLAVVAIAAATAIAQAYSSEKARGANKSRLNQIKAMFESIVPPEYDISPNDPPQYITQALKGADFNFDVSKVQPEAYQLIKQYSPQAAQYVAEANPTLVAPSALGTEGRQSQIDALRNFIAISKGNNPELSAALAKASRSSQEEAEARTQSLIQAEQRRGTMGSGRGFAAMLQSNSDAMLRGADEGRDAAVEAYRARMQAVRDAASMGRSIYQDDVGLQERNADIINQFNQRTSRNYQDYLNQRTNTVNQAELENIRMGQDIANRNVQTRNQATTDNMRYKNDMAQRQYENQRDERNYQNSLISAKADWQRQERARQNDLKSKTYQDQLNRAGGMSSIGMQQIAQNTQNTQDRNSIIGAVGSAGAGYYANEENQRREDERYDKYLRARYGDNV